MKFLTLIAFGLVSVSAFARDITLKIDLSNHIKNINSVYADLVYVSKSNSVGCTTYSGDIMDPIRPIYIEKSVKLSTEGIAFKEIPTKIERCDAELISVDLKIRMDRKAVARAYNVSKSEVDKNRIDFNFHVSEYHENQPIYKPEMRIHKLYVAGQANLKYTFSVSAEIAQIINDRIDLTL